MIFQSGIATQPNFCFQITRIFPRNSKRNGFSRTKFYAASECACLVCSARFWLVSFGTESARAFHEMGHQYRDDGSPYCRIDVFDHGGKTCQADKGEDVGRLRAAERPLRFRLRSIELVHDVHLRERPIDAGTVLALLPAERPLPRTALLRKGSSSMPVRGVARNCARNRHRLEMARDDHALTLRKRCTY